MTGDFSKPRLIKLAIRICWVLVFINLSSFLFGAVQYSDPYYWMFASAVLLLSMSFLVFIEIGRAKLTTLMAIGLSLLFVVHLIGHEYYWGNYFFTLIQFPKYIVDVFTGQLGLVGILRGLQEYSPNLLPIVALVVVLTRFAGKR